MVFHLTWAARVRASAQPLIDMMGGLAVAAVIVYGGHRVIDGATTPGAFFSFITAALMAYQPLRALSKLSAHLQEGLAAAERVFAVLDTPATITNPATPHALPPGPGPIAFENVTFSYDGENTAIRDVSFTAEAGRVTALIGPSGAGKSTIFELIPRFFDVGAGSVRINGVDVRDLDKSVLRNALAIVSQDIMLFDDSVLKISAMAAWTPATTVRAAEAAAANSSSANCRRGIKPSSANEGCAFQAANANASPSRGPFSRTRHSCCWMRRPAPSTANPSGRFKTPWPV